MIYQSIKLILIILIITFSLNGCSSKTYTIEIHPKKLTLNTPKRIALFLDGTHNDRNSRTNISKLYEIVANQNKDNLYLFYNEGVGVGNDILGMGAGLGIGKDVREAYEFLSNNYSKNSELYLFGFSRGAYTARILAGMMHTVGIYDLKVFDDKDKKDIILSLYTRAYKGKDKTKSQIKSKAQEIIDEWRNLRGISKYIKPIDYENTKIKIMGLWDTVEALGVVPTIEAINEKVLSKKDPQNIINPNKRYFDQVCNINHILHALSLDDNRAYVFTPIILSNNYFKKDCKCSEDINISKKVNEVWFSGAHSDVGGGYEKDNTLPGVSLNWMISEINKLDNNLLPKNIKVYEDVNGYIHNAEGGLKSFYRFEIRDDILEKYIKTKSIYGKLRLHPSVIERLEKKECKKGYNSKWYESEYFKDCFDVDKNTGKVKFLKCKKIEVIKKEKQND
jgi:uncharacterized protein (DUF2235 family)